MQSLINGILEKQEKLRVSSRVLLPLGVLESLAKFDDIGEKFLPEVLTDLILDPHGDEIKLRIHIHSQGNLAFASGQWFVP